MGPVEILLIIFVVLKLCSLITWSWWLVLLPLWFAIVVGVLMGLMSDPNKENLETEAELFRKLIKHLEGQKHV